MAFVTNDAGLGVDYQGELRRGVEQECVRRNLDLLVYAGRTDYTPYEAQRRIFQLVHPDRIDGVVVAAGCLAARSELDDVQRFLLARRIPAVSIGQVTPGMPSVLIDNEHGAGLLVNHLVKIHARRHIAILAGPAGHEESEQRLTGTHAALARHGIELRPEALVHGDFSVASGAEAIRSLVARGIPFDAVIAANDDMALGALDALRAAGLHCPRDVALTGFDDSSAARFADLPITTVRQPIAALGATAVQHLGVFWAGDVPLERTTLETELILRESCGCRSLRSGSGHRSSQIPGAESSRQELVRLLRPLLEGHEERERWATELEATVAAEQTGTAGAFTRSLGVLARQISDLQQPIHELQLVITSLRNWAQPTSPALEDAFHAGRALIGELASRHVGEHVMRSELVLEELRLSWERLATALTLPALQSELVTCLPRLGIDNALIALQPAGDAESLMPLVYLCEGAPVDLPQEPYPAEQVIPDQTFESRERTTLLVMPLTFEAESLGVAVMALPRSLEIYTLLREQIGSAIKTAQLHQEVLYQERLRALAAEEERVTRERLASLALIAGGVAHDLNNVLGPLVALPETIRDQLRESGAEAAVPRTILEDLETIREAGQRAAVTIRDLLVLGRPHEAPEGSVELNRLVEQERRALTGLCAQRGSVTLSVVTCPTRLVIRASRPHLVRALSNLVINGADAIEGPGTVTLRVSERELAEPLEGIERVEPGQYAVVEVEDTGSGIAAEHLPHILEPFYTTRRHHRRSGTGLGLAIVQRIVKDSMGCVQVTSAVGQGTRITLYFPREDTLAVASSAPPLLRSLGSHERILVVDDEVVQLRTARRVLERLGYFVVTAPSGEEALALVDDGDQCAAFDLLILDMVMPGGIGGLETLQRVRERRPGQRALIVSGYSPEQVEARTRDPDLGWLAKPYTMEGLGAAVRALLQRSSSPPASTR